MAPPFLTPPPPTDTLGRPLHDLRISVTDRCNLRCGYCMPREVFGEGYAFLPRAELLSFEEIARLAAIFAGLGVRKLRLTGGEPLLRRELPALVAMLGRTPGVEDLALTTNGVLLQQHAAALHAAGLRRVTVSLDALAPEIFRAMSGSTLPVESVWRGIEAARAAGFSPVKINTVVRRGVNEGEIVPIAQRFRGRGYTVRFIEYMDVGNVNGWQPEEVVPAAEIIARLEELGDVEALPAAYRGEVARRYRRADGGEVGVIASVSRPFCRDCTRARLTADGRLFTCLFAGEGLDLRAVLRGGASDAELRAVVARHWRARGDRYSELRAEQTGGGRKAEMSLLGG